MKAKIDQNKCVGCLMCVGLAEEVFRENAEGFSEVYAPVTKDNIRYVLDAMNQCHMKAIKLSLF